jgi:two-component system phosphate regulon sensor histidine kinase PhoR
MLFWIKDYFILSFASSCAFGVQYLTGQYLQEIFLFIAVSYSLKLILQITQLERSLRTDNNKKIIDPKNSIWDEIQQHIFHANKASKKRQKKLIRIIKKFRKSTAALPDAVVVLGKNNEIDWFNNAAKSILGFKKKDKGQYILNLIHTPEFINFIQEKKVDAVLNITSPTEPNITLEIKIAAYGKNSYLLVAHDISYLKNIERMRKDFVDNISHELRTPLTVLKGYLETLAEMPEEHSPLLNHSLQQMKAQSDRMQYLTDDLLLLANLETEKSEQSNINIPVLLEQIRQESSEPNKKKQRLELISNCNQPLLGNLKELHSAFSNLIINALKYSPKDSLVKVRWYKDKHNLILDVIDKGEGISQADLPRITERFYRADVKRTQEARGTGLGLAIVKHVLVRHNAQLNISSQLGKGSTFSCVFDTEN